MQKTLGTFHSKSCTWKTFKNGLLRIVVFFFVDATITAETTFSLKIFSHSFLNLDSFKKQTLQVDYAV